MGEETRQLGYGQLIIPDVLKMKRVSRVEMHEAGFCAMQHFARSYIHSPCYLGIAGGPFFFMAGGPFFPIAGGPFLPIAGGPFFVGLSAA